MRRYDGDMGRGWTVPWHGRGLTVVIGLFVDELASAFADIDQAKHELDKRFYPKSDVTRDNKD